MPNFDDRRGQILGVISQKQQPQSQAQNTAGFDQYLSGQLDSIRRSMNTIKTSTFADTTRLNAMNTFIRDFGEIFGGDSKPVSLDAFKQGEKEITGAAKKISDQLEMLNQGKLSTEEFFHAAQDVFDDLGNRGKKEREFQLENDVHQKEFIYPRGIPPQGREEEVYPTTGGQPQSQRQGGPTDLNFETIALPNGGKYAVPKGARVWLDQDGIPQWEGKTAAEHAHDGGPTSTKRGQAVTDFSHLWK